MKFAVCAIIKNENLYLREWVEHYINLGFDKIILYDNNDINGEIPQIVIQDYIDKNIVDLYNYRGQKADKYIICNVQCKAYNECLSKYTDYDWILFIDIDEFLQLEKFKDVHYVFENNKYNDFNSILISSYWIGDDNKLYYENKPITERFTKHVNALNNLGTNVNLTIKSWVKPLSDAKFNGYMPHHPISNNICNVYEKKVFNVTENTYALNATNYEIMWYKHYYTKSLTEFLYRTFIYNWTNIKNNSNYIKSKVIIYKNINSWTEEHEKVYQNFLKQNNIIL